uniref:Uncharacterized protein n=1 Tax=Panagrolaimus superbus TaxID=310955 RepID=A0A914YCA5_9BILA
MDENVENKEIKIPEEIIETSNLNIEDDKEDNGKNLIHRKPINFSFNKQKFKKIPNFTARKIPTKKCYESESDEEDVRMENTISILYPVENSKTETSDIDIPDGQLKTVIPKAVTNANKSSKLPRASGDKIKRNLKPKFKSTGYIPPANQKADLSKEFDEMVKSLGICDEIVDKTAAVECVKEKKTMMDFGSEAEYSDEESPEYFTSPKSEAAKKDTVEKDDKAKKEVTC